MANYTWAEIGRHRVKLSNLDKVLFPEARIVKAELIKYYLSVAPHMLSHIKHRPMTFIRFPDGINGESFFQKNKPQFAPEWLQTIKLGKSKPINYLIATNAASLVWFANQASIEFHQQSIQYPQLAKPDHFVIDLDPPEGMSFTEIKDIAFKMKLFLELHDYVPFVKTSGKKGLHVLVPIRAEYSYDELKSTLKKLAAQFVNENPKNTTLSIRKEARSTKLFLDIVRNSQSQTTVCPYSVRAVPSATVSMPVTWDELETLSTPTAFTIDNVPGIIEKRGDAWVGFSAHSVQLHDHRKRQALATASEALDAYINKRNFDITPEPVPDDRYLPPDSFVIQRHQASRTHYDLRIVENGVLRSWALPKGLPPAPGTKFLAIQTEAHPLSYFDFQGDIPKGQYGAGRMDIVTQGSYTITKTKKNGLYFKLKSDVLDTEYRIHLMQDNEWLLERVDESSQDVAKAIYQPMLCMPAGTISDNIDFRYEVKWDGIRAILYCDKNGITICSRSGRDITSSFPELAESRSFADCTEAIIDGEIVALESNGAPSFRKTVKRLNMSGTNSIKQTSRSNPVYFYAFDLLYADGINLVNAPLWRRQKLLNQVIKEGGQMRISESMEDGAALFTATMQAGLEGIIGKDRNSKYQPGVRSEKWIKIKHRKTVTCQIIGFTEGKGDRQDTFGALHLVDASTGSYLGKVGSGFDDHLLRELRALLEEAGEAGRPEFNDVEDIEVSTWISKPLFCEVQYASITASGTLREPVFLGLRPDLTP